MAHQNFYATKLDTSIGASDTSFDVTTPPSVTSGYLVLEARNATQREIISYSGVSGNTLTGVVRGLTPTSARPHLASSSVEMNITAQDLDDIYDAFDSFSANNDEWRDLTGAVTVTNALGQRSAEMTIAGDHTALIGKGTRLRVPRTSTAPTMSGRFIAASSQYAQKTTPTGIIFTDDFTMEAKVNLSFYPFTGGGGWVMSRLNAAGTQGFGLQIAATTGKVSVYALGVGTGRVITTLNSIPVGRLVHIAATVDASAGGFKILFDGIEQPATVTGTGTGIIQPTDAFAIGRYTSGEYLDFIVSEVRLWSAVRTTAQIRDNMDYQLVGNEAGLVGYWKLNGNFNDSTTNANNLTASGGAIATYADAPFAAYGYGIITTKPVFTGGNTTFTVQCPEGYPIPKETLGTASYSGVKAPAGFPIDPLKWDIQVIINVRVGKTTASAANTTVDTLIDLVVPAGSWTVGFRHLYAAWTGTSTTFPYVAPGLSTSTTNLVETNLTTRTMAFGTASVAELQDTMEMAVPISPAAMITYNLLAFASKASNTILVGKGTFAEGIVFAEFDLL